MLPYAAGCIDGGGTCCGCEWWVIGFGSGSFFGRSVRGGCCDFRLGNIGRDVMCFGVLCALLFACES